MIKYNHGCGYNIIVNDKTYENVHKIIEQVNSWLNEVYWKIYCELQFIIYRIKTGFRGVILNILLCERNFAGHRKVYMEGLLHTPGMNMYYVAPEEITGNSGTWIPTAPLKNRSSIIEYFNWIRVIRKTVKQYGIDVVHVLDGDSIMKFMGVGFGMPRNTSLAVTYHHFFGGFLRKLSYRGMLCNQSSIAVVHTDSVKAQMESISRNRIEKCAYPAFNFDDFNALDPVECRKALGVPEGCPVIGIVGGLSAYKRIIPFLRVMERCTEDFRILICGRENEVLESNIDEAVKNYSDRVIKHIRRLSNEEYALAIGASDIIFSLYGLDFEAASGPMSDGICCQKMIIASDHGSLGETVRNNHLGFTAPCMDEDSVLKCVSDALKSFDTFSYDETAIAYRHSMKLEHFLINHERIYRSLVSKK